MGKCETCGGSKMKFVPPVLGYFKPCPGCQEKQEGELVKELRRLAGGLNAPNTSIIEQAADYIDELEKEKKHLQELLHFGNLDRTMVSVIGKAAEEKRAALGKGPE